MTERTLDSAITDPTGKFLAGVPHSNYQARLTACAAHFSISALVAALGTFPFVFWLYPQPFLEAAGGLYLIGLICLVDLVMGPLLTFVVYNKAKKSLRMDLAVIGILQLVALGYGIYALSTSRPVFLTYVVDRFEVVTYADVDKEEILKAPAGFQAIGWGNPQMAYAIMPTKKDDRETVMFSSINGVDLKRFFRFYEPINRARQLIREKALPIATLKKFNDPIEVSEKLAGLDLSAIGFVPIQGIKKDLVAIIDLGTGELVKTVKLKPW
jgi:hypothetical protein